MWRRAEGKGEGLSGGSCDGITSLCVVQRVTHTTFLKCSIYWFILKQWLVHMPIKMSLKGEGIQKQIWMLGKYIVFFLERKQQGVLILGE